MQDRRGSSRYPDDLVEKFSIQEDQARKYVPKEDKTLVLNFKEYWNMSAERKGSKRFSPYKNSLNEQFKLISYDITQTRELITFIWASFYKNQKKTVKTFYLSHPSFYKSTFNDGDIPALELKGVTLRLPLRKYDLILNGDIMTVEDRKIVRKEYIVKYFSLLNKSPHYGEKKVSAALITRVFNSSMQGFYTTEGALAEGFPADIYQKSIINEKLILDLNELFIVDNPGEAIAKLNSWSDLLSSEMHEADLKDIAGYIVKRPEFMMAFPLPPDSEVDEDSIIVRTPLTMWVSSLRNDSRARMLVRLTHPVNRKQYEKDPKYIDKFNKFTTEAISIVDPTSKLTEKDESLPREIKRLIKVGSERICPAIPYGLDSTEQDEDDEGTLTVFFEVPLGDGSLIEEIGKRTDYFSRSDLYKIIIDQTGTKTIVSRQMDALESFKNGEISNPYLASYLFSSEKARSMPNEKIRYYFGANLNELQKSAVNGAVNSDGVFLIQGPPGTGKTQVISEITMQEVLKGHKVLITSQNNKAVDNAFDRLYRNSMIRPVRLMSEDRTSDYDLDCIVSNFYKNIGESLKNQLNIYGDPGTREYLQKKFETVKGQYEAYIEYRDDAEDTIDELEMVEEDLVIAKQKLEDSRRRVADRDQKIALTQNLINGLENYELTSYSESSSEIKDLFRNYLTLTTIGGNRDTESEIEGKLFGQFGYCSRLMRLTDDVFDQQISMMSDNVEYVDLHRKLYRATSDSEKTHISDRMTEILNLKNLAASDFIILEMFGSDLPHNLPEIRDRLARERKKAEYSLESRMDRYRETEQEESCEKDLLGDIEEIEEEIAEFKQDKAYMKYVEAEATLTENIQDMYRYLKLSAKITDLEGAFDILEKQVEMICSLSDDEIDLSTETYRDIINYLEDEKVAEIDHDHIMTELKNYINVFGITCTAKGQTFEDIEGSSSPLFLDATTTNIDVVIIDEVSKVPFSELLRPILSGRSVILVGDHKQLPPIYNVKYDLETANPDDDLVKREERFKELYVSPLFKELFDSAPAESKIMLRKQYRMSGQIMNAINRFYDDEGGLEMGCSEEDKLHRISIRNGDRAILDPKNSVVFINCEGTGVRKNGSTSFENEEEAQAVSKLIQMLESNCHSDSKGNPIDGSPDESKLSLGVISPYAAQTRLIRKMTDRNNEKRLKSGIPSAFRTTGDEKFTVKSVDDFQGDERDIIIISLVRTGKSKFLSDFRRINVAMSRARRLLVLVGNASTLEEQEVEIDGNIRHVYKEIIDDIRKNNGYLESADILEVR